MESCQWVVELNVASSSETAQSNIVIVKINFLCRNALTLMTGVVVESLFPPPLPRWSCNWVACDWQEQWSTAWPVITFMASQWATVVVKLNCG